MSDFSIIDTHIHLYPASEIETLAWCSQGHKLRGQFSVEQYKLATSDHLSLRGFVFVETDRKHHLESDEGWKHPLEEVEWITRVAAGKPRVGEGHSPNDRSKCLAVVPWAPVPLGRVGLARYIEQVKIRAGEVSNRVVGFRYLLQDKAKGTMLQPRFIDGLRWLGEQSYSFDLGVDYRSGGIWQLDEAIQMIQTVQEGASEASCVVFVISKICDPKFDDVHTEHSSDHLCKPDMMDPMQQNPSFEKWSVRVDRLAKCPNVFMKLSGVFSEMSPLQESKYSRSQPVDQSTIRAIKQHVQPWCTYVLKAFGPERVLFGSDWPVCNVNGGPKAWAYWKSMLQEIVTKSLGTDALEAVFSGNARKVYKVHTSQQLAHSR